MHILVSSLAVAGCLALRNRRPLAPRELTDALSDGILALRRRLGGVAPAGAYPAARLRDPREAAAAIAATVAVQQRRWPADIEKGIALALRRRLGMDAAEAAQIAETALWLAERDAPAGMRRHLIRRLGALSGPAALPDALALLHDVCGSGTSDPLDPVIHARRNLHRRLA